VSLLYRFSCLDVKVSESAIRCRSRACIKALLANVNITSLAVSIEIVPSVIINTLEF
jgi:hypothetical protein